MVPRGRSPKALGILAMLGGQQNLVRLLARRERWLPTALVVPVLLGLIVLRLWPVGISVWETLHGIPGREGHVGFRNYSALFSNPACCTSVTRTLVFNAIINPLQVAPVT